LQGAFHFEFKQAYRATCSAGIHGCAITTDDGELLEVRLANSVVVIASTMLLPEPPSGVIWQYFE